MTTIAATLPAVRYAGFWRQLIAMIIDYLLVTGVLFVLLALLALAVPRVADLVDLSAFGRLVSERTLETFPPKTIYTGGGETKTETDKIVESTVAGRWVYLHKVTETVTPRKVDIPNAQPIKSTRSVRLDPVTRAPMSSTSMWYYFWLPWLVYAVLMESGGWQATLGKKVVGIDVTTDTGQRPSYVRSLVRNLVKLVSLSPIFLVFGFLAITVMAGSLALILTIAFFTMAAWTPRKQALQDMIAKCLVVVA